LNTWLNKQVLVLGLGETGLSMVRWLSAQGAQLRVADSRTAPPGLAEVARLVGRDEVHCGAFNAALFDGVDLIAISPGVALSEPHVAFAVKQGIPVVGDIELFAQQLNVQDGILPLTPTLSQEGRGGERKGRPLIIAITGANGKTTVTSMVEHLCKVSGKDAVAAGNISPAVLDVVMQRGKNQPEIWVLELSSFQLETTSTLDADVATVLNISEDHLDRYAGMDAYAAAKQRIFAGCKIQLLNRDDPRSMGMALHEKKIVTFGLTPDETTSHSTKLSKDDSQVAGYPGLPLSGEGSIEVPEGDWGIEREGDEIWLMQGERRLLQACELQVAGLHNVANALAALALCSAIDLPMPALLEGLRSFKGLPHRVERVTELQGVVFYDDSKGTNVGATVAALQGLGKKAVLIAGGVGKDQDFSPLRSVVKHHARAVVLIGRDAPLIEAALQGSGVVVHHAADMTDAVRLAAKLAQTGDAVLLSPACASFDMYRNYAHRAEVFVAAVQDLSGEVIWSP